MSIYEQISCPHCETVGNRPNMLRWHFENCKILKPFEKCPICSDDILKRGNKTCSRTCAVKYQWHSDPARKIKAADQFVKYANKNGRPKGTKNKQPYPVTAAVLERYKTNIPPSWAGKTHTEESKQKMSDTRLRQLASGEVQLGNVGTGYMKGQFKCKNPQKYLGNPTNIIYRSSWEFKCMMQYDHDPNVVGWSSEEVRIAYLSPIDNKIHTYYPDFLVKEKKGDIIRTSIVEVKPYDQTIRPKAPSKMASSKGGRSKNTRYIKEAMTYGVNMAKWAAAEKYCAVRGMQFVKLTENELFGRKMKS